MALSVRLVYQAFSGRMCGLLIFDPGFPLRRLFTLSSELFKVPIEGLRALFADRRFRWAIAAVAGLLVAFFVAVACALQFWLFPRINDFRSDLAERVGQALGVSVEVGHLHGEWSYLHPRFVLDDVVVFSASHRPAVHLSRVGATLSWWQMMTGKLGFRSLSVAAPALDFRRDRDGHLFLADLPLDGGGDFRVDSLLEQGELSLVSDRLSWTDATRTGQTLTFQDVNLRLRSSDARHRLDIGFAPPAALGAPVQGRLEWIGRSFSEWHEWKTKASLKMGFVDLAGWTPWVDYPVALSKGLGKFDLQLETTGAALTHVDGSLALTDLKVRLAPGLDELVLKQMRSQVFYQQREEGRLSQLKLTGLSFTDAQGKSEPETDLFIERKTSGDESAQDDQLALRASRLDLARLHGLARHLPVPEAVRTSLAKAQPSGLLQDLHASARFKGDALTAYSVQTSFDHLSVRSDNSAIFVKNLSGKIDLDQDEGRLNLDSTDSVLAAPGVLPINQVPLAVLAGKVSWKKDAGSLAVKLKSLQLRNEDLQASVNGSWSGKLGPEVSERDRAGVVDMKLVFDDAKTESAWKYVPLSASSDISAWMKDALSKGSISDFRIEMAGPVWDMPYGNPAPGSDPGSSSATGVDGRFYLGFKVRDLTVKYAENYPVLEKLDASFDMNQNRIAILSKSGVIDGMQFSAIKADMDDASAFENHLKLSGQAQGATQSVIRFLKDTPVATYIHHFANPMSAEGKGILNLSMDMNLAKLEDIRMQGSYQFMDNRLTAFQGMPPVSALNGIISFSESSLSSTNLQGQWSGEPLSVKIATGAQGTTMDVSGRASVAELRHQYDIPLLDQLAGKTSWQLHVGIQGGQADLALTSDLKGLVSSMPEPFNKTGNAAMPLTVERKTNALDRRSGSGDEVWRVSLGNALAGTISLNGKHQPVRGRVILGSGQAPALNGPPGIHLESLRPFNLDYWVKALGVGVGGESGGKPAPTTGASSWSLKAPAVTAFGRRFQDFRATVQSGSERTTIQLASREVQGDVDWVPPGKGDAGERGLLQGHLTRLDLTAEESAEKSGKSEVQNLPDLSFKVDELFLQGTPWGRLSFRARNQKSANGQSWRVDPLQLDGPDLRLTGRLNWVTRANGAARKTTVENTTALDFKMNSPQVGNLLTKLGFPGTVKRGTAQLEGQISWPATPFGFDPGRLSGNFKMSAKNGQFAKMDPGVGRLLGLLSLQSLPQRFSLDFRDIFSGGLAFETIDGHFDIRDGLMKTSDLEMDTPAARVLMRGETNLAKQTQDVRVVVRPALSNSIALGVTVLNPIAGAATFVTQKVLGDPLSRLFSYQYHITGTWSDPLVDKESLSDDVVKDGKAVAADAESAASAVLPSGGGSGNAKR